MRLIGQEYVQPNLEEIDDFYEGENSHQNYDSVFTLKDFQGTLPKGQYSFPFSFMLPSSMSGSYNRSDLEYIRYNVKAILNHPSNSEKNQFYEAYLNVMEPLRSP